MDPIATYRGQGTLFVDADTQAACHFECTQVPGGKLRCRCRIDTFESEAHHDRLLNALGKLTEALRLEGETDASAYFEAHELFSTASDLKVGEAFVLDFIARRARSLAPDAPSGGGVLCFGLTNLELNGTAYYDAPGARLAPCMQLPLTVDEHKVFIRPLADYPTREKSLWATKETAVTAEAIVPIQTPEDYDAIEALMADLGMLLSLARGCQVVWVYRDFVAEDGTVVERYHRGIPTRPYSALALIPPDPPKLTREFIHQTFDAFRAQKARWDLPAALQTYTEAKQAGTPVVIRGLLLVALLEFLKGGFLRSQADVPSSDADLLRTIRQALKIDSDTSLRDAVGTMAESFGLRLKELEMKRLEANREALMQRAGFKAAGNAWEEYVFLLTLASRLLLAILGYAGAYNDWSFPIDEMLVGG